MKILILGANGFIGSHLSEAILEQTNWSVYALDLAQDKLKSCLNQANFHFKQGDMTAERAWIAEHIQACDVVLPLVAIATPSLYVQDPLRVFSLDFEENLKIVRLCVQYNKRIIFPSTSEVYGMCHDPAFDEETSSFVTGPTHKERWIYSTSKQLLDRLIYAYGKHNALPYTLFRPFNWYGSRLDNILNPKPGGSRVLTQFLGNILRGEPIQLVNGGTQKRSFTFIDDGIDALLRIIENKNNCAANKIFNIGNPQENLSIKTLAELLIELVHESFPNFARNSQLIAVNANDYYGSGYQDVELRTPAINRAQQDLGWQPRADIRTGLRKMIESYTEQFAGLSATG